VFDGVFDGNGKVETVSSGNANGQITRKEHVSGTYTAKADCTGTAYGAFDLFIAPDGSMFTFVQIKPKSKSLFGKVHIPLANRLSIRRIMATSMNVSLVCTSRS